jgi:hypothetical protein
MRSIGDVLGAPPKPYPRLSALPYERLTDSRRIVLCVIDGLGAELLQAHGQAKWLDGFSCTKITSVYPPTTASALTTFMSGLAPQQHGITGWFVHFRAIETVMAVLPFVPRHRRAPLLNSKISLPTLVDCPSFFNEINPASITLQPKEIVNSEFSRHLARGAQRVSYKSLDDFVFQLKRACRGETDAKYIYAYWPELDRLAHLHGPSAEPTQRHVYELGVALESIAKECRKHGALLIVTADHGFIDSGNAERVDLNRHPSLSDTLNLPLCGEPRTAFCYVKSTMAPLFENYVKDTLKSQATLIPSQKLVDDAWFGLGTPHPELNTRIGNYTLQMLQRYTIRDQVPGELDIQLQGVHGGISAAEQLVPLLVAGP